MKIYSISIRKFAIASAVLWASLLIYLPPFQPVPGMFQRELTIGYIKAYGLLFFGVLSGVLMIYRYQLGRIIALILAIFVLYSKVAAMFPNISQRVYGLYVLMLKQRPFMVIHNDLIFPLFMVYTLLYLTRHKTETSPGR